MDMVTEKIGALKEERSFKNLYSIICSHGDAAAAEYQEDGEIRKLTYADYERISVAAADKLSRMLDGTEKNTFVALRLPNSSLWPAAFWAIIMAGYRPLLVDANADDAAVMHVLRQAGSRTIVTDSPVGIGGVTAIMTDSFLSLDAETTSYIPVFGDAIALCTSGTTATPKVYVYKEDAICEQVLLAEYIYKNNQDIIHNGPIKQLAFLPFHHIFGLIAVYMWYTFFGKTIVYIKNRTADVILSACKEHKVTHIYAVPLLWNNVAKGILRKAKLQGEAVYEKLINASDLSIKLQRRFGKVGRKLVSKLFFKDIQQKLVGDSIQFMISGGGHIQPETLKIINSIGYPLVSGFGMTETGIDSVELSDDIDRKLDATVGKPFAPMQYRIVYERPGDKTGELQIYGKAIHSGRMVDGVYIPREEGWFSSGDIAREEDGRFYIEGRLKDVIVGESGENVYPDELEDSFSELPHVEHICVAGVATKGVYDDITLIVYMGEHTGSAEKTNELVSEIVRINGLLPIYKKLKRAYISLDPLPLANGIKVRRQKVKEALERGQGRFQEIDVRGGVIKDAAKPEPGQAAANGVVYNGTEYQEIKEKVRQIFADVLGIELSSIKDTDHFVDDLGGDSLSSLGVFSKAEELYGIIIPDTEYFSCATVEDLAKLLYRKLNNLEDKAPETRREALVGALGAGAVIGVPTDTVYGIAARWDSQAGVRRLFAAKGRSSEQPVGVLFSSADAISEALPDLEPASARVLEAVLPGPFTLIVSTAVPRPALVGTPDSIGVRVPDHPALLELLGSLGTPLAATSANLTGRPDPATLSEVDPQVLAHCSCAFAAPDPVSSTAGPEASAACASTVVDLRPLASGATPVVLREGAVPAAAVLEQIATLR